jgi:parvulin-like peptidyl-prolyl isomerase
MKEALICAGVFLLHLSVFGTGIVFADQYSSGDVLATVGEKQITAKDLETRIRNLPPEMKEVFLNDAKEKEQLLKELARIEVFSREASRLNLDKSDRFKRITSEVIKTMLAEEYTNEKIISRVTITEEDAELYYQTHKEEFRNPEGIVASFVWIKTFVDDTQDKKNEKKRTAEEMRGRLAAGELFSPVADRMKKELVDVQVTENEYLPRGRLVPEVEDVVFKLGTGKVSPVIPIDEGFLVFKIYDKVPSTYNTYDEVRENIFEKLGLMERQRVFKDEEQRLFAKYGVEIMGKKWQGENKNNQSDAAGNRKIPTSGKSDKSQADMLVGKIITVNGYETGSSGHEIMGTMTVGDMGRSSQKDTIVVEVLRDTEVLRKSANGYEKIFFKDLKTGQIIEIMSRGPMTMSYPPTVQADRIVVTVLPGE